jgi:hypothetical protein
MIIHDLFEGGIVIAAASIHGMVIFIASVPHYIYSFFDIVINGYH